MAKKDVDEYFNSICKDYHDLIDTLHEMEEEVNKGLLDPDKLLQLKYLVEPAKVNWQRISYIMYLLNKPAKKSKEKRYHDQNKKMIQNNSSLDDIHKENLGCINRIRTEMRTS